VETLTLTSIKARHQELCAEALEIFAKKNADYARSDSKPFSNFELPSILGVCRTDEATFIRLLDKISRMANLLRRDPVVTEEQMHDTIIDALNYLVIIAITREWWEGGA